MKKVIIGGLVGSVILFIWQFASWAMLDLHYDQMAYTPKQDQVLQALKAMDLEPGDYMIPRAEKGAGPEAMETMQNNYVGKPWAMISYRPDLQYAMGMNLLRGWMVSLVSGLFFAWIILQFRDPSMKNCVIAAMFIGLIGYFVFPYLNSIWFSNNTIPDLIDAIVPWTLFGGFMGWYANKDQ